MRPRLFVVGLAVAAAATAPPCRSDADCGADLWRCQEASNSTPPSPEGACHLPGPTTPGNSTCACANATCDAVVTLSANAGPRFLMIGDSVSIGAQPYVVEALPDVSVSHNPGNADSTTVGRHCVDEWLADVGDADVVSINFGLHDVAYDTERIDVDRYKAQLRAVMDNVDRWRAPSTKVLWISTTPVPTVPTFSATCNDTSACLNPPRYDDDVRLYNDAARDVVANSTVDAVLDLYSLIVERCGGPGYSSCDGVQLPMNVHFTAYGYGLIANATAEAVRGLLGEARGR